MLRILAACVLASFLACSPAHAQGNLSIDKLWVEFGDGLPDRADVVIRNDSKERYYITVASSEVTAPGTEQEARVAQPDPEAAGLLVTPNRLILEPGAMRSIRLVSLNTNLTKDRIYRVLISPEVAAEKAEKRGDNTSALQIKMLAAYDVLVIARPAGARPDLKVERKPDQVVIANRGNTNILVSEVLICPATVNEPDPATCRTSESRRLYADMSMSLPLEKADEKVFVKTRAGPNSEIVTQTF